MVDRREMTGGRMLFIKFPVQPVIFATLERHHNGLMRGKASTSAV